MLGKDILYNHQNSRGQLLMEAINFVVGCLGGRKVLEIQLILTLLLIFQHLFLLLIHIF